MKRKVRIIALTETGFLLANRIHHHFPEAQVHYKPKPFVTFVQTAFTAGDALLMICASGIVVRSLAPIIKDKYSDPPVLIMDEQGKFVIPLLSGHEGGANHWADQVATALNAQLVLTSAQTYVKPIYTVGMGCERGCSRQDLKQLLDDALQQAHLCLPDIHSISSISIKADEQGLIDLATQLKLPYYTFSAKELGSMEHLLSVKSNYIYEITGVYGVAESAALFSAQTATQEKSELILNKIKTPKATCAIARSYKARQ